ncbi:MAG: ATP-binding protein [Myxococcaceae bacterium]
MTLEQWTSLLACAGELTCAALALRRVGESSLARPLALLSLNLFAWNFAEFAYSVSSQPAWQRLDVAASPWSPALGLLFTVTFVGKRQALRWGLWLAYLTFGSLSAVGLLAFFFAWAQHIIDGNIWSTWFLLGLVPTAFAILWLLYAHLHGAAGEVERSRTRLVLLALATGSAFGATDLLAGAGLPFPRLANLGVLFGNVLLLVVTVRFRLLRNPLSFAQALVSALFAGVSVFIYVQLLRGFAPDVALPLLASTTLAALALALFVPMWSQRRKAARRLHGLAALGRVSDQLAHDLKNPLAALRGAAQFLREEIARGNSVQNKLEFFDLLVEQTDRLGSTIERYRRLGRVEPQCALLDVNALVQHTLALQPLATGNVSVKLALSPGLSSVSADADLLAAALHNLVRNSIEAMPNGGTLTVSTQLAQGPREAGVRISVEDTGIGMDARAREQAFEDFFTTKASGTGLGLAFVRRVVEAHRGEVQLTSHEGRGTRVQMFLPTDSLLR